jgi:hypothetical protein
MIDPAVIVEEAIIRSSDAVLMIAPAWLIHD